MHTHARMIVQGFVHRQLILIHAARRELLCAAVSAVMSGHLLSLSRLARGLMGQSTQRAALKRVDRLMGNARIAQEAQVIGAALLRTLCRSGQPLVIAVDWSQVAPDGMFVELRAVATRTGMGRGLTIYQEVYPESKLGNARVERALLKTLHGWMPAGVSVIIVTDAGFRRPWFTQIERLGWSWIGRIRAGVCVSRDRTHWEQASAWFAKATGKACRWSNCWLTVRFRFACDMVLYRRRAVGGKHYGRAGHGSTPKARREAKASAREPWLLAHAPQLRTLRAEEIVALYGLRMQIEENFRDSKSTQLGMGLEVSQSRSASRLHALLLIGTLAAFLLWHIGQLAEAEGLHLRFKATTRLARELSIITLAKHLCALHSIPLTDLAIQVLNERLGLRI
ncbi:MAG TPA: IS4 family transposase [Steroidobacteraceae bacterium]|nr:IS4 family transposase [Steroidobacteraceae bacterium]